jgi:hypothetical protein
MEPGARCEVASKGVGTIRFVGETAFAPGVTWIGVELDAAAGKNDGSVQGVSYFKCAPNHGLFVKEDVVKVVGAAAAAPATVPAPLSVAAPAAAPVVAPAAHSPPRSALAVPSSRMSVSSAGGNDVAASPSSQSVAQLREKKEALQQRVRAAAAAKAGAAAAAPAASSVATRATTRSVAAAAAAPSAPAKAPAPAGKASAGPTASVAAAATAAVVTAATTSTPSALASAQASAAAAATAVAAAPVLAAASAAATGPVTRTLAAAALTTASLSGPATPTAAGAAAVGAGAAVGTPTLSAADRERLVATQMQRVQQQQQQEEELRKARNLIESLQHELATAKAAVEAARAPVATAPPRDERRDADDQQVQALEGQVQEQEQQLRELEKRRAELQGALESERRARASLEAIAAAASGKAEAAAAAQVRAATDRAAEAEALAAEAEQALSAAEERCTSLGRDVAEARALSAAHEADAAKAVARAGELEAKRAALESELRKAQSAGERAGAEAQAVQAVAMGKLERQVASQLKELEELQSMVESLTVDKEMLEEEKDVAEDKVLEAELQLEQLKLDLAAAQAAAQAAPSAAAHAADKAGPDGVAAENEKLREALKRLHAASTQDKAEALKASKALRAERDAAQAALSEAVRAARAETTAQIEELKQSLDAARGSEALVERLSERNLELGDEAAELRAANEELEELRLLSEEVEEQHAELAQQLRRDIETRETRLVNLQLALDKAVLDCADAREATIRTQTELAAARAEAAGAREQVERLTSLRGALSDEREAARGARRALLSAAAAAAVAKAKEGALMAATRSAALRAAALELVVPPAALDQPARHALEASQAALLALDAARLAARLGLQELLAEPALEADSGVRPDGAAKDEDEDEDDRLLRAASLSAADVAADAVVGCLAAAGEVQRAWALLARSGATAELASEWWPQLAPLLSAVRERANAVVAASAGGGGPAALRRAETETRLLLSTLAQASAGLCAFVDRTSARLDQQQPQQQDAVEDSVPALSTLRALHLDCRRRLQVARLRERERRKEPSGDHHQLQQQQQRQQQPSAAFLAESAALSRACTDLETLCAGVEAAEEAAATATGAAAQTSSVLPGGPVPPAVAFATLPAAVASNAQRLLDVAAGEQDAQLLAVVAKVRASVQLPVVGESDSSPGVVPVATVSFGWAQRAKAARDAVEAAAAVKTELEGVKGALKRRVLEVHTRSAELAATQQVRGELLQSLERAREQQAVEEERRAALEAKLAESLERLGEAQEARDEAQLAAAKASAAPAAAQASSSPRSPARAVASAKEPAPAKAHEPGQGKSDAAAGSVELSVVRAMASEANFWRGRAAVSGLAALAPLRFEPLHRYAGRAVPVPAPQRVLERSGASGSAGGGSLRHGEDLVELPQATARLRAALLTQASARVPDLASTPEVSASQQLLAQRLRALAACSGVDLTRRPRCDARRVGAIEVGPAAGEDREPSVVVPLLVSARKLAALPPALPLVPSL